MSNETQPELIAKAESLYFSLSNNLTIEAKNVIWHLLSSAKKHYPSSSQKSEWESLINHMEDIIRNFDVDNESSDSSELKLYGLQKNLNELIKKEQIGS